MERFFSHFRPGPANVTPATTGELERCRRRLGAPLPTPYSQFLRRCNGGHFGDGVLHIMGVCRPFRHDDLVTWNQPYDWKASFARYDLDRYCFFADDRFGNQFGYRPGETDPAVWRFDVQVGEFTEIAPTMSAFFDEVLVEDGQWMLGADYLEAYQITGAPLEAGQHLSLIIPSLLGGSMNADNLRPVEPATGMYLAGQALSQMSRGRPVTS